MILLMHDLSALWWKWSLIGSTIVALHPSSIQSEKFKQKRKKRTHFFIFEGFSLDIFLSWHYLDSFCIELFRQKLTTYVFK